MSANVGTIDRLIRFIVGVALIVIGWNGFGLVDLSGVITLSAAWMVWAVRVVGIVMTATAVFSFCPAYTLLGVRTCSK